MDDTSEMFNHLREIFHVIGAKIYLIIRVLYYVGMCRDGRYCCLPRRLFRKFCTEEG